VYHEQRRSRRSNFQQLSGHRLKEPMTGDLLIVGDGSQTSYRRGAVSWKSLRINAQGRTKILRRNYRNARPILLAAAPFAENTEAKDEIPAVVCDPAESGTESHIRPLFYRHSSRQEERAEVVELVRGLLKGRFGNHTLKPLEPSDIGLIYRQSDGALQSLVDDLAAIAPVVWVNRKEEDGDARQRILEPGIKVQTIHSAKGLEYRAVILPFADQLAARAEAPEREKRLFYVALTRAREALAVTCTVPGGAAPPGWLGSLVESSAWVLA